MYYSQIIGRAYFEGVISIYSFVAENKSKTGIKGCI